MMIKEIIKKNAMALVAIAIVIGFSAFKLAEDPESGWYTVSTPSGDPQDPGNQIIGSHLPSGPAAGCDFIYEETPPCAVFLNLPDEATIAPTGLTVEQATDTQGYNAVVDEQMGLDGYATQEENP